MQKELNYPYQPNYCDIGNNIKVAYGKLGKGSTTLLFVHGLASYGPVWYGNALVLSKKYQCILIDLPGNGLSSRGDYPYTMFFYAECIAKFIEKLNLKNVVLIGHSMGGHIAIIFALRYPHVLKKLILIAPSGFEYFNAAERLLFTNLLTLGNVFFYDKIGLKTALQSSFNSKHADWVNQVANDLFILMDKYGTAAWQAMVKANIYAMINEQVSMFLPHINCKTLIVFGKNDALIPLRAIHMFKSTEDIAKEGASLIKNAKLVMFNHCGHLVQIECAAQLNTEIDAFV